MGRRVPLGMSATDVRETLEACGFLGCKSDAHGVAWGPIRFERGSGIAGNLSTWWLAFPGSELKSIGPLRTRKDVRGAIGRLARQAIRAVVGIYGGLQALADLDESHRRSDTKGGGA